MMSEPISVKATLVRKANIMLANDHGVSTVEVAVLLATVATCISIGIYCLGELSSNTFEQTASAIGTVGDSAANTGSATEKNEDGGPAATPVSQTVLIALAAAFVIGCGSPVAYILFRMKRQSAREQEDEEETEPVAAPPSATDLVFAKRQHIRRVFEENQSCLLNGELRARHIMSRQVSFVYASTKRPDVEDLFDEKSLNHVVVRDKQGDLVGVISKTDLLKRDGKSAQEIMTRDPYTVDLETNISVAITQIISRQISCLPVLDSNKALTGVISATDFLLAFQCAIQTLDGVVKELGSADDNKVARAPRSESGPKKDAVQLTSA